MQESVFHLQDGRFEIKGCQVLGARWYAVARKVFATGRELLEVDHSYLTLAGHGCGNSSRCSPTERFYEEDTGHRYAAESKKGNMVWVGSEQEKESNKI